MSDYPNISTMVQLLKNFYDPPVRGLTSKKKRVRKKAQKRFKLTLRGMSWEGNP